MPHAADGGLLQPTSSIAFTNGSVSRAQFPLVQLIIPMPPSPSGRLVTVASSGQYPPCSSTDSAGKKPPAVAAVWHEPLRQPVVLAG
jgi:hypothetical protein